MNPTPEFDLEADADELLAQLGLPRRLLRHLVFSHSVGPGSRVLDVGCGSGKFLRFLERLGITTAGLDTSADSIKAARAASPHLDFHCGRADQPLPFDHHRYDLVVVRNSIAHMGDLLSASAFRGTAELLARVRPGAHLTFLIDRSQPPSPGVVRHEPGCYRQHLAVFPGIVHDCEFTEHPRTTGNLRRMLGRVPTSGYFTATLTLASEPISRTDWLRIAERAARVAHETCCARALQTADLTQHRSAA